MAPSKPNPAAATVTAVFAAKAREVGVVLEDDDLMVLADLQATTDDIAALDAALRTDGRIMTSKSGTAKVHPALSAVRQLRVTSARLMAVMDGRITAAKAGAVTVAGGQPGVRGVQSGNGTQNQKRDGARAATRGEGRTARLRTTGRGA